jgi:hypothetical protein
VTLGISVSVSHLELMPSFFPSLWQNIGIFIFIFILCYKIKKESLRQSNRNQRLLTLSNPIFLPTAYSPALICFGRESGWWITCNYPTVLKEKNMERKKEYNLRYLLAKVHTTSGKSSDRLRQRANKRNRNIVGRLPTLEQNWKIILSDEVRCRIGKG